MHDDQAAGVAVEFHLAVQRDTQSGLQHVGEIAAMEPLSGEDGAGGVGEGRFKQPEIAAAKSGKARSADLRQDRGHLSGRERADWFYVATVLIAKRRVEE